MSRRNAAIIGPTPEFLIWAVDMTCPLKTFDRRGACYGAFRQLRALQECSRAELEDRVIDGVAFHRDSLLPGDDELLGFLIDETLNNYGGRNFVSKHCSNCTANLEFRNTGRWAGCFGLAAFDDPTFLRYLLGAASNVIEQSQYGGRIKTNPAWYGLWTNPTVTGDDLQNLGMTCRQILESKPDDLDANDSFAQFVAALEAAFQSDLTMKLEYFPAGNSDGLRWEIPAHCGICKACRPSGSHPCIVCGATGQWQERVNRKVLGIRPYLRLADVIGTEHAESLRIRLKNK
ncbi:MAG: hypothetical protein R3C03_11225 [Pirellulaceae bacterium]